MRDCDVGKQVDGIDVSLRHLLYVERYQDCQDEFGTAAAAGGDDVVVVDAVDVDDVGNG